MTDDAKRKGSNTMTVQDIDKALDQARQELDIKTAECNHLQGYIHALQDVRNELTKPQPLPETQTNDQAPSGN